MPTLALFGNQFPFANGDNILFVVQVMGVIAEELKEQLTQGLLVLFAIAGQRIEVIVKGTYEALWRNPFLVGTCLKTGENRWISRLEEVDNQADPCIRT